MRKIATALLDSLKSKVAYSNLLGSSNASCQHLKGENTSVAYPLRCAKLTVDVVLKNQNYTKKTTKKHLQIV